MSVILTDMKMPNNCRECRFAIGKGDYRYCPMVVDDGHRMRDVSENTNNRHYDCPMRSVDELIKWIETDFKSLIGGEIRNKAVLSCIETIRDYCEEYHEEESEESE